MQRGLSVIALITVVSGAAAIHLIRTKATYPGTTVAIAAGNDSILRSASKPVRDNLGDAGEAALALKDPAAQVKALLQAVDALADWDVEFALRWTREHVPAGLLRDAALLNICGHLAATEPDIATELAVTLPPSPNRDRLMGMSASLWARADPAAVLDWLGQLPPEQLKPAWVANVGLELVANDLPAAVELAQMLPFGDSQNTLLNSIGRAWSTQDPSAAAAWISAWPESLAREAAITQIASQWARLDSSAAGLWIKSLPPGSSRDRAAWIYAETVAPTQPALALAWAAQINDSARRAVALAGIRAQ